MVFSVSNDGIELSLETVTDSAVKNFVEELTITSLESPLAAWSLLLSQRQEILNNHLARVPNTPNQKTKKGQERCGIKYFRVSIWRKSSFTGRILT